MNSFFKIFLAVFLALVVFSILSFVFFVGIAGSAMSGSGPVVAEKTVLQLDLSTRFEEHSSQNFEKILSNKSLSEPPSFYDLIRLIKKAKNDKNISGIFIKAGNNSNGFANSDEIRSALKEFKSSGKFIMAYADIMSQNAYAVANVSNKIYVSPKGVFEWYGMSVNYLFLKGALDKLEIKPQIFYAGKFKSATEPLRVDKMTDANKLQTTVWLNDIYNELLLKTADERKIDTASLKALANAGKVQTPEDAVKYKLIDGVKYDDEVKDEIKKQLKIDSNTKINFLSISDYATANKGFDESGDEIAVIYASGDIVDGEGKEDEIGSEKYIDLIRKARFDNDVKAIVLRVNSGGGSALASENILQEMKLAKKVKPVMVSFGDVAASGGYYISVAADSIFASRNSITGSIGVFGLVPDMSTFFKNKLGVTFDGVKTGPLAEAGSVSHPMTEPEKKIIQSSIERIYADFKERVATGRKKDTAYIETIAQGRVWTGLQAKEIGLVDAFGGLETTIAAAAKKAKLTNYKLIEYPKPASFIEKLFGIDNMNMTETKIKNDLGIEYYNIYKQLNRVKQISDGPQARLPFEFTFN